MIGLQGTKVVMAVAPFTTSNAGTYAATVDTLGYDCAKIIVLCGDTTATSKVISAFTVKHSDDTTASNFATFTGCVTTTDYTLPTITASDASASQVAHIVCDVDLKARKRYLQIGITCQTVTGYIAVPVLLGKAAAIPTSTTNVNARMVHAC